MLYLLYRAIYHIGFKEMDKGNNKRLAQAKLSENVFEKEYAYVNDGIKFHKLNVYSPKDNKETLPLLIDIHGGGWSSGDKETNKEFGYYLSEKGKMIIAQMSYRLVPKYTYKEMVDDIFSSIKFLMDNQKELKFDPNKIYLTGDSAGAQLCLLFNTINNDSDLQKIYKYDHVNILVKGFIFNHPVTYINQNVLIIPNKPRLTNSINKFTRKLFFGRKYTENIYYKTSSSDNLINYITEWPKLLIISGIGDTTFYPQTARLIKLLDKNNIKYKALISQNKENNHVYNIMYPTQPDSIKVNDEIINFINN